MTRRVQRSVMPLRAIFLLSLLCLASSCKEKETQAPKEPSGEVEFVATELGHLKQALASKDIGAVIAGCMSTTMSMERMPQAMRTEIAGLCHVDAPRLYLAQAVADAKEGAATSPELSEISCMNLFVEDAFKTLREHPTTEPGLLKLVEEYSQLCPKQVAKFGGK